MIGIQTEKYPDWVDYSDGHAGHESPSVSTYVLRLN